MNQLIIDAFRNGLMHVCLWVLAALAVCALLLHVARRKQVRPVFAHIPPVPCVVLLAVMAVCTLFSGKNTNSPPAGVMSPILPPLTQTVVQMVTEDEIAQGYRLESVTTNDAVSYTMPTNGVAYAPWTLGGGYEAHFPLDLGDFAFPFGTGVVHRLDVLSGGMVESLPRQRAGSPLSQYSSMMSICAAREWASIVPGVGRFWWADAAGTRDACPYQGKVLTWENVYAGRDRTGQYNAQIELREDGNFTMRSGEGLTTTESSEFQGNYGYPHERMVGDVKLHLDDPRSGWLCRIAGVSIAPDSLSHIYPCGSVDLDAALSCCRSNAYLGRIRNQGCSWYGGAGITFSQEHSLSTEATYDPSDPEDWTTNVISLVGG